jgi:hypothetical protein
MAEDQFQDIKADDEFQDIEPIRKVGPDATATFDNSASNPTEHDSSESISSVEDDQDEDLDEDDDLETDEAIDEEADETRA